MPKTAKKAAAAKASAGVVTGQKDAGEERPKDAPFLPSAANTLTDNAVPASAIAAATSGDKGDKADAAKVNAASMDAATEKLDAQEAKDRADEDNSVVGKIRRSGLVFNRNHNTGEDYVGISVQQDPNASTADKKRTTVAALDGIIPRTGMEIRLENETVIVPDGFGPDGKPDDWAKVLRADGKSIFD